MTRRATDTLPAPAWYRSRDRRSAEAAWDYEDAGGGILREIACPSCGHKARLRLSPERLAATFKCSRCGERFRLRGYS